MASYSGQDKRLKYLFEHGGGGGSSTLADLGDVDISTLSDGQILKYNATTEKWENVDDSGVSYFTVIDGVLNITFSDGN